MATKAIRVNKNDNTVVVVSDAETLSLQHQELRTDADATAVKQGIHLGLNRAGIGDERMTFLDPDTKQLVPDPRAYHAKSENEGKILTPCKVFTLR